MNRRREALILGAAGILATGAGFLAGPALLRLSGDDGDTKALFDANFEDLAGNSRKISEWKGRPLVCNFWATWCAPCREEIPLLIGSRQEYASIGLEVLGIAIDSADKVRQFVEAVKIPYPILTAGAPGIELMRQLGNPGGGLPYTVIVGRDGRLVRRKLGAFRGPELEDSLAGFRRAA